MVQIMRDFVFTQFALVADDSQRVRLFADIEAAGVTAMTEIAA
jgi:hypothetical protein